MEIAKASSEEMAIIEKDAKVLAKVFAREKPLETKKTILLSKTKVREREKEIMLLYISQKREKKEFQRTDRDDKNTPQNGS